MRYTEPLDLEGMIKGVGKAVGYMLLSLPVIIIPVLGALFLVTGSPFFASAKAFNKLPFREAVLGGTVAGILWGLVLFLAILVLERAISIYPSLGMSWAHYMLAAILCFTSAIFGGLGGRNPL